MDSSAGVRARSWVATRCSRNVGCCWREQPPLNRFWNFDALSYTLSDIFADCRVMKTSLRCFVACHYPSASSGRAERIVILPNLKSQPFKISINNAELSSVDAFQQFASWLKKAHARLSLCNNCRQCAKSRCWNHAEVGYNFGQVVRYQLVLLVVVVWRSDESKQAERQGSAAAVMNRT